MKLSSLSLLAVAGFATASPVSFTVVSKQAAQPPANLFAHIRLGLAAAGAANTVPEAWPSDVVEKKTPIFSPVVSSNLDDNDKPKLHCSGAEGLHSKAVHLANIFRQAFGLPLIEEHRPHHRPAPAVNIEPPTPGEVRILPYIGFPHHNHHHQLEQDDVRPLIPMPPADANPQDIAWFRPTFVEGRPMRHHRPHFRHGRYRSFVHRINRAFSALGPWESYAVGFVFGCGLGTLARMIYVLLVVFYRSLTRQRSSRGAVSLPETPEPAEPVVAALVQYEFVDEKVQPPTYVATVQPTN